MSYDRTEAERFVFSVRNIVITTILIGAYIKRVGILFTRNRLNVDIVD